jgi:hypothetical protein
MNGIKMAIELYDAGAPNFVSANDAIDNMEDISKPKKNNVVEIVFVRSHKMADPSRYMKLKSNTPYVDTSINVTCVLFIFLP